MLPLADEVLEQGVLFASLLCGQLVAASGQLVVLPLLTSVLSLLTALQIRFWLQQYQRSS
jgi:hypothetical protein